MRNVLIVDDHQSVVRFLTDRLSSEGYQVKTASTGASALGLLSQGFRGVVLLDVRLPDTSGLELFQRIRVLGQDVEVIFMTAYATIDMAVEATRQGAFDFLAKGTELPNRLTVSVKNAFEHLALSEQLRRFTTGLPPKPFGQFITCNPGMERVLKTLEAVVNSAVTVLIEGESGTGKELIARAIHLSGSRRNGPFVPVNCAGIPETLLESEMFGYEKGAFTGATARRAGKFEAANGGTLFLDEVGELPKSLQAKLLRVLQDHTFERVGGNETISVDVRVVSATNRDLMAEVGRGNFREDLYYRLSVFPVRLPPLRERPDDIPLLAQHFLKRFAKDEKKELTGFSTSAMSVLASYPFPGNVRELENMVRHAVILARGPEITESDILAILGSHKAKVGTFGIPAGALVKRPLPERLAMAFPDFDSIEPLREVEHAYVRRAMEAANGNISKAARALGLGRATLYRWMKGPEEEVKAP